MIKTRVHILSKSKQTGSINATMSGNGAVNSGEVAAASYAANADNAKEAEHAKEAALAEVAKTAKISENLTKDSPVNKRFISKLLPDTAQELITFLKGLKLGNDYSINELGEAVLKAITSANYNALEQTGFGITQTKDGKYQLNISDLNVWRKAVFNELEKRKLSYVGGNFVFSACGSKIKKVEDKGNAWRCYFYQDDGSTATTNLWEVDDQARCQIFNIKAGVYQGVANRNYWRKVVAKGDDYIDLSKTDCEQGSDAPQVDDTLVQFGNKTKPERQGLIMLRTTGEPALIIYSGINGYTLEGKAVTLLSPSRVDISANIFRLLSSSGSVVDLKGKDGRDGTSEKTYIRYSDDGGKTFTKSKINHIIGDIATSVAGENRSGQVPKQWSFYRFDAGEVLLCALVEMSGNTTESPSMYFQAQPNGGVGGRDVIRTPWTNLQNGVQVLQAVCTLPNSMTDNGILNMRLDNVDGTIKVHDLTLMYRNDVKGTELTQDNMFLSGKETGKYIGIATWDKPYPPLNTNAYTWSAFKGEDGKDAEIYRLKASKESAKVTADGLLICDAAYTIEHVQGTSVEVITSEGAAGNKPYVSAHTDKGININVTAGANNTILYKLNGYFDLASRPDNIIVELYIKANGSAKIVDTRVIPILMEAMSYTRMVRDMRENISANGRDISTIRQAANSVSVKVNNTEARLENGDFVVKSDTTKFIGSDGQKKVLIKDGKVSAELIDTKQMIAEKMRTKPDSTGLSINIFGGVFEVITKYGQRGISMEVDGNGFPHLIFYGADGRPKYDLGGDGLARMTDGVIPERWSTIKLSQASTLNDLYPHTTHDIVYHEHTAAYNNVTGTWGANAEYNDILFTDESFSSNRIADGIYTTAFDKNIDSLRPVYSEEALVAEDGEPQTKPTNESNRIYGKRVMRYHNGKMVAYAEVLFKVNGNSASYCDKKGNPIQVESLDKHPYWQLVGGGEILN